MIINRSWAMPNKNTFSIKPINKLIKKYLDISDIIIDPFAGDTPFLHCDRKYTYYANDLDREKQGQFSMDALEYLKGFIDNFADLILFDSPYSPRQVSECYKKMDKTVNMQTTQSSFWGNLKKEITRVVKPGGYVITCGWNSGGIGKTNGFEIVEILLVAHGGWHNDTIVTVERRIK